MTKISAILAVSIIATSGATTATQADTVTVMAGELPPMMTANGTGREAEIITDVMSRCGHEVVFKVQPFTRHWSSYEAGMGDAVATVPAGLTMPGTQTGTYIQYQNGVSSLAEGGTDFSDLATLSNHTVIAFKGAADILPDLKAALPNFKSYQEAADQIVQSRMIFAKRADAVIGDGLMFAEFNRQLRENSDTLPFDVEQEVSFNATFEPSNYVMTFRNPDIAADFDRCFAEAEADGALTKINQTWVEKYRSTLGAQYLGY